MSDIMTPRNSVAQNMESHEKNVAHNEDLSAETISHGQMSWGSQNDIVYEIVQDLSGYSYTSISNIFCAEDLWNLPTEIEEKRQEILESEWGGYALDIQLWNQDDRSEEKISRSDIELTTTEYRGILTDRIVEANKSFLTKSPEDGQYILAKCELKDMNLIDISTLHHHRQLQYLDLSHNKLQDLTPLGELPYLMYLDVSHNKIKQMLNFSPNWYLTHVDLSHNELSDMCDISQFWSIVKLNLSYNNIENISGLQNLKYLQYLNLGYNYIECVDNLDNLKLKELNLECNCITSIKFSSITPNVNILFYLNTLILCYNELSSLEFLKGAYNLRYLDLRHNKVTDLLEISNLRGSIYDLDLRGNPCTKWSSYKDVILYSLPDVKYVDDTEISVLEKVSAMTHFAPPMKLNAAQNITKLYLLDQLSAPKIDDHIIPYDQTMPPLIILCGPCSVKKLPLAMDIVNTLPKKVRFCRSHTTREMPKSQTEKSYFFVDRENFNEMTRRGEFLSVHELLGHSYGFLTADIMSRFKTDYSEIAQTIKEKKIGITQMDLGACLQLQSRYPNIKIVLVLTKDEGIHRKWICEKFEIYPWLKSSLQNLLAVKIGSLPGWENTESSSNKVNFISQLVEQVVSNLNVHDSYIEHENSKIIGSENIVNSHEERTKHEISEVEEKRHITFQEEDNDVILFFKDDCTRENNDLEQLDLMVIMNEESKVMINTENMRRKKRYAKLLSYRNLIYATENDSFEEDSDRSLSSNETLNKIAFPQLHAYDLEQEFVEVIVKSRLLYVQQYQSEPGFFSLVIFSDEYLNALNALANFIRETYINYPLSKFTNTAELSDIVQKTIPTKVQSLLQELET